MILAMGIGNTNFVFAQREKGITNVKKHETALLKTSKDFTEVLKDIVICPTQFDIEGAVISSVVPSLTSHLIEAVQDLFEITPIVVNSDMHMSLDLSAYNKKQIGNDRITICEAAIVKYTMPAVIFDFGTATTINIIDDKCSFLGGSILTGVTMGLEALSKNTAQLPKGNINECPVQIIGSNTEECLISGAVYGNAAMLDGMIDRIEVSMDKKVTALVTGGNARFILPFCKSNFIYDEDLQVEGLYGLYNKNAGGDSFES